MKICGFSIVRQGNTFGYPFVQSLKSLLPLVDELVVGVGDGDDATWETLKAMREPRLKLFRSTWDRTRREGGQVLSVETNKALARCKGDWGIYLQADEVLHEDDLGPLKESMRRAQAGSAEGLSFRYLHFYGSYATIQDQPRKWYRRAVRAVRLGRGVASVGDAYGFRINGRRLRTQDSGVRVFHYGWTRPPWVMVKKQKNLDRMYHEDSWLEERYKGTDQDPKARDFYADRGHLKFFQGSHPAPMRPLAAAQSWTFDHRIGEQWPVWMRRIWINLVYPFQKRMLRWSRA